MRTSPLIALALAACGATTRNIRLSPTVLAETPHASPIRLFSAALPRCPFQDVGLTTSRSSGGFTSDDAVLDGLRAEARLLGGDAVVHVRFISDAVLSGTVIRFTAADCKE
jgi:hypothetical protein